MNIEIDTMTINDLPLVLELERHCFFDPWNESMFLYELKDNAFSNQIVIKAKENDGSETLLGFAIYWITFDSATICQICVHPDFRRKHLASSLMKEIVDDCFAKRVQNITLEVRASNEKAIKFYEKHSFKKETVKPHYYSNGEDAIYMIRKVDISI